MLGNVNMDSNMFMKLLMTELRNQNPMEPMDSTEMMTQIAQLATVESVNNLNASFKDLLKVAQMGSASGLAGKEVEFRAGSDNMRGTVDSVSVSNDKMYLNIDGYKVNIADVLAIF